MRAVVEGAFVVEDNHYFPPDSVKREFFSDTDLTTVHPWKGTANYYSITVDGDELTNVAWHYPTQKDAAAQIRDYVAFYP